MHRNTLPGLGLVLAALLVVPAVAQDDQALLSLLPGDPNGFVSGVQEKLASGGLYSGKVTGTLTKATIRAINAACRDAGVLAACQSGPLSPAGAVAVVTAVSKLAQGGTKVAAPADEPAPASPAEPATGEAAGPATSIATTDWKSRNGNGLTITPTVLDGSVVFAIEGTAEGRGTVNIYASDQVPSAPGEAWVYTVDAALTSSAAGTATAFLAARAPDGSYLREVVRGGVPIDGAGPAVVEGTVPEGAAFVQPYIQVKYATGATPADTLTISGGTFGKE